MEEDWDNLLILDACRYDLFEEVNTLDGVLDHRHAVGSTSQEYFERNFNGEQYYDTVYVSANPFIKLLELEDVFYHVEHVWDTGWDDELKTVTPSTMVEATKAAFETYPNKRIIAHFMQPNHPFIGPFGQKSIPDQTGFTNNRSSARNDHENRLSDTRVVWKLLDRGEVDKRTVERAYRENLELTLPHVQELLEHMGQKTVVTSDHGNLIDERIGPFRLSGHPGGIHVESLVKVPWLVTKTGTRKKVREADHALASEAVTSDVEDRLEHLGYA